VEGRERARERGSNVPPLFFYLREAVLANELKRGK